VKVGNLVQLKRFAIGIPEGSIGLIYEREVSETGFHYYQVQFANYPHPRKFLGRDLEILDESVL
jgi:hypothetical protein